VLVSISKMLVAGLPSLLWRSLWPRLWNAATYTVLGAWAVQSERRGATCQLRVHSRSLRQLASSQTWQLAAAKSARRTSGWGTGPPSL